MPRRRLRWWWLAIAGGVALDVAAIGWLLATVHRPAPAPVVVAVEQAAPAPRPIITMPPPLVVVAVPPAPAPEPPPPPRFTDLGPCPAPYRTSVPGQPVWPRGADFYRPTMSASPTDSRRVALWDHQHIYATDDGGHSWARVLDGSGQVLSVAFDCHGRLHALRDGIGLGMRDGSDERWRPVPGISVAVDPDADADRGVEARYQPILIGGGRLMAVAGAGSDPDAREQAQAGLTGDGGATWRWIDLGWYEGAGLVGAWTDDTLRVLVPWTDCMSEGVRRVTSTPRGVTEDELPWMSQMAIDGSRVHGMTWQSCSPAEAGDYENVCTWAGGRLIPVASRQSGEIVDGPVDVLIDMDGIHRLTGRGPGPARAWDGEVVLGVDAAGRVWGESSDSRLIRR